MERGGQINEAYEKYEELLKIQQVVLGDDHADTMETWPSRQISPDFKKI